MASRKAFSSQTDTPKANPLLDVTFTLDEEEFRCEGRMSFLDLSDMARRVSDLPTGDLEDLNELDPMAAAAMIASMSATLLMALGDAEYRRFRDHCRTHETPDEVIVEVMQWINAAVKGSVEEGGGRPTGKRPRSSSGAPATAGRMSRIISLQHGDVTVLPEPGGNPAGPGEAPPPAKDLATTTRPKSGGRRRTA